MYSFKDKLQPTVDEYPKFIPFINNTIWKHAKDNYSTRELEIVDWPNPFFKK
jgi:hypothetical protein